MSDIDTLIYNNTVRIRSTLAEMDEYLKNYVGVLLTDITDAVNFIAPTVIGAVNRSLDDQTLKLKEMDYEILRQVDVANTTLTGMDRVIRDTIVPQMARVDAGVVSIEGKIDTVTREMGDLPEKIAVELGDKLADGFGRMAESIDAIGLLMQTALRQQTDEISNTIRLGDGLMRDAIDAQTKAVSTQLNSLGVRVSDAIRESNEDLKQVLEVMAVTIDEELKALRAGRETFEDAIVLFLANFWEDMASFQSSAQTATPEQIRAIRNVGIAMADEDTPKMGTAVEPEKIAEEITFADIEREKLESERV